MKNKSVERDIAIFGDLHLVDFEPRQKASRRYKDPAFSIDDSFSAALRWIRTNSKGSLTLIINGDFIDFDLIYLGAGADVATAKRKFDRVFRDHRSLFEAIVSLLADGKTTLVLILGNHDLEFTLSAFRDYFFLRLSQLASELGFDALGQHEVRKRITVEPWFYYERDLLYVEHGDRFDRYGTSPRPLKSSVNLVSRPPFLSLGSLSNRFILKELPTFNPFMGEQVIHRLWGYLGHLLRHYLIPPHRLPYLYLKGAVRTFSEACRQRAGYVACPICAGEEEVRDFGREKGLQEIEILRLWDLGKKSVILTSLFRTFHILWLDRVCLFCLFATALLTALTVGGSPGLSLTIVPVMVLFYWLYESLWGKQEVLEERRVLHHYAEQIGQILHTPFVILSHSHRPQEMVCDEGWLYLNCGSWAPIFEDRKCLRLWTKGRTFVHLCLRGDSIKAQLIRWTREGPVYLETSE